MGEKGYMINTGVIKALKITITVALIAFIFLNPLTYGKGDISRIKMFSDGINEILRALGGQISITSSQMLDIILFTEYSILGLSLITTTKAVWRDLGRSMSESLLVGLISAVIIAHIGDISGGLISGTTKIMTMFYGLLVGIGIYLLIYIALSGFNFRKSSSRTKYRRSK